jgi:hypothetical protein
MHIIIITLIIIEQLINHDRYHVPLQAKRSMHDAQKSVEAEARAKEAAAAAQKASEGAAAAAAAATASAEKAAQTVVNARAKLNGPIEELAASTALLTSAEEDEKAAAAAAAASAAAKQDSPPAVHVTEIQGKEATRLHSLWETIERSYLRGAKLAFSGLRRLRQALEKRMVDAQKIFASHLLRADERQSEVTKFQKQFNSIDLDLRSQPEVQAELALQVCSTTLEDRGSVQNP